MEILKSASKIILLMLSTVLSIAYLYSVITGKVAIGDTFDKAIMLVFGFYFAYKGKEDKNYLGK